ncbi:MAG: multicopper oxidase family protein [Verrucomicrobia bacterium]|nr:multicopper oxidase family protein [Verrucomicrobiota bacterium]MBS0645745.1 multicopper oxidase family protein [Verrucomicrobiota bacterium]
MRLSCVIGLMSYSLLFAQEVATYGCCTEATSSATHLKIVEDTIQVLGRTACVYKVVSDQNEEFLCRRKGECFNVVVDNYMCEPTSLHWHGLILPNLEDGVSYVTQAPIQPGQSYGYNFQIVQSGSYFAHSHYGLQEQLLINFPVVFLESDEQECRDVIVCLEDFSFHSPTEIWQELRKNYEPPAENQDSKSMSKMPLNMKPDLNDVHYDAYLCNRSTLEQPKVYRVCPEEKVRLRFINASTASGFHIMLGQLQGELIAVDGQSIEPISFQEFPLATAQRVDVLVSIPKSGGVFPILAQGQGTNMLAGVVLKTEGGDIPNLSMHAQQTIGAITNEFEKKLHAVDPLVAKKIDRTLNVELGGRMDTYVWSINGHVWPDMQPLCVKEGERVELVFINHTEMSHPMHLHGHVFQVVEIDGQQISGAKRDTILVMPHQTVKVVFDAVNPGLWLLHCHIAYHAWAGMLSAIHYEGYEAPCFPTEVIDQYAHIYGGYGKP